MLFPNFETLDLEVEPGVRLRVRHLQPYAASSVPADAQTLGAPILLLHGHPQTHAMWQHIAPQLVKERPVVMMDLRGYGDSSRPVNTAETTPHETYSKRRMALDAVAVMTHLGYPQFEVLAHDRGARVAHRLAADHPEAVLRMMLLDIAPTLAMYEGTTRDFAKFYWHWFFYIQAAPFPEQFVEADPLRYIRQIMGARFAGKAAFTPEAMAEYERCIQILHTAHGICEDYRASAGLDLDHDRTDIAAGRKVGCPVHVIWGKNGVIEACFDADALWRERCTQVTTSTLPCGHYIAEEQPEALMVEVRKFFKLAA